MRCGRSAAAAAAAAGARGRPPVADGERPPVRASCWEISLETSLRVIFTVNDPAHAVSFSLPRPWARRRDDRIYTDIVRPNWITRAHNPRPVRPVSFATDRCRSYSRFPSTTSNGSRRTAANMQSWVSVVRGSSVLIWGKKKKIKKRVLDFCGAM